VDGRELLRRLALRWPLVGIGLLLAVVVGGIVFAVTPATYTAQAGVLILPPTTDPGGSGNPVNPLSSLDSGTVQVASTLVYTAGSQDALDTISSASNGGTATVVNTTNDPTNDTPFIQITATGDSAEDAIQAGSNVPRSLLMRLTVIVAPVSATASGSALIKAGGLAAGIVFVLALLVIGLLDRFLPADTVAVLRRPLRRIGTALRGLRRTSSGTSSAVEAEPTTGAESAVRETGSAATRDMAGGIEVAVPVGSVARGAVGGD
jgi:hypothetical protein